ncbi:MAG: aconitate hydratase AcnA [Kiritimatiellaeota bacterium]|nr:aconitate hydratase AcnA [Kiritimatiellota bacterium]
MKLTETTRRTLTLANGTSVDYFSLPALAQAAGVSLARLPFSIRILLEAVLRQVGHPAFAEAHALALARWTPDAAEFEFPFLPARVLLQDFTGVPCVADLAALRGAMQRRGQDPRIIEPLIPVDLVIDHSIQLDVAGNADALSANLAMEFERNRERYAFLRWGQGAFTRLHIVPPGVGICHQVNLEYLARGVMTAPDPAGRTVAFPDTLVGTDSHTTMINGLGIVGWGVGGIEAEAAMLGQPIPITTPKVTGVKLTGALPAGATATDLALTVTQRLRAQGVVGHFVEFFGPGLDSLTLADRATVANMAPEYGATMGFFPMDGESLRYLRETGRSAAQVDLVERYVKAQGLWRAGGAPLLFNTVVALDLASILPVIAGPQRPHDRLPLGEVQSAIQKALTAPVQERGYGLTPAQLGATAPLAGGGTLTHGALVIASITSCTNTSNPHVLLAAGLLAKKAVQRGLRVPAYVRTSFAPGSRVVTAYLQKAGVLPFLEQLGFHVAAYGCATCIGNSGPLDPQIETALKVGGLVAASVLSGNRNFEGRIHPHTKANFLASPPLVVAYALAGTMLIDLDRAPLAHDAQGRPVFLKDLWPTEAEIRALLPLAENPDVYRRLYAQVAESNPLWNKLAVQSEPVYAWDAASTYLQEPPFLRDLAKQPETPADIVGARCLGVFGDFITTDHISPAGSIPKNSPAGQYLIAHGVAPADFNSYGARRGNHEVMVRGTFANVRIRNRLVAREGGWTVHVPTGDELSIFEASQRYEKAGTPLIVLAGKMYGAGSSRDWAAKGPYLLGVKVVIAESFERIHRSNLVEMGILPLEFTDGQTVISLGLTGRETFSISGIAAGLQPGQRLTVTAAAGSAASGPPGSPTTAATPQTFAVKCRIDSAIEVDYHRHGGILPYVLRQLRGK